MDVGGPDQSARAGDATLDLVDRALLEQLLVDNRVPALCRLAERLDLSERAVLRRLRREGAIAAAASIVQSFVLGLPLTLHLLISPEREWVGGAQPFHAQAPHPS